MTGGAGDRAGETEGTGAGGTGAGGMGAGGAVAGGSSFARTRENEIAAQKTEGAADVKTGIGNARGVLSTTRRAKRTAKRCM